jgi:hypothetical protein
MVDSSFIQSKEDIFPFSDGGNPRETVPILCISIPDIRLHYNVSGACGRTVVEALPYKPGGRGVETR